LSTAGVATRIETLREAVVLASAIAIAFMLGGAAGYALHAEAVAGAAQSAVSAVHANPPCPPNSHPVVWYTAETWGCITDGGQS